MKLHNTSAMPTWFTTRGIFKTRLGRPSKVVWRELAHISVGWNFVTLTPAAIQNLQQYVISLLWKCYQEVISCDLSCKYYCLLYMYHRFLASTAIRPCHSVYNLIVKVWNVFNNNDKCTTEHDKRSPPFVRQTWKRILLVMLMLSIKFYVATKYGQIVEPMFPHQLQLYTTWRVFDNHVICYRDDHVVCIVLLQYKLNDVLPKVVVDKSLVFITIVKIYNVTINVVALLQGICICSYSLYV